MTPWLALCSWAVLVAGMIRGGPIMQRISGHPARRCGSLSLNRRELHARGVAGVFATLAVAPIVTLFAIRKDVGTDYSSYVEIFERFRAGEALSWMEPIYAALNRLAAPFGSSGVVLVFAVSAALASLPLFYRVFRSSPMPWMGVLILFGLGLPFFMTNAVRSAISISIVMLVLPAIWRRELFLWSLGVLLAAGFHFTALLVWPLYWVLHRPWPRALALAGLASAVALSTSRDLAVGFLQWAPMILPSTYAHYPGAVLTNLGTYEFGFGYLIYLALGALVLAAWNRGEDAGHEVLVFRNAAILGLTLVIGLYQFWAVNRLGLYFMPALAVFLPWVLTRTVSKRERGLWTAGILMIFGSMFLRGLWTGAHQAVPYQWIL